MYKLLKIKLFLFLFFLFCLSFTDEADLSIVVENCWLSDKPYAPLSQGIALIQNRCIKDNTFEWHRQGDHTSSLHFSFRFTQRGAEQYLVYLRCDLAKCTRKPGGNSQYPSVCCVLLHSIFSMTFDITYSLNNQGRKRN